VDLVILPGSERLPAEVEAALYRVVQECLTNIHRHSGSTTATIRLHRDANLLTVQVQDSGKGMSMEKQHELIELGRGGVGFTGMRERLRRLGGTLEIKSDGSGTVVSATLTVE
jgi:signal transduction histidine kinase